MEDWDLLQQYVRDGSQQGFAELVSRHIDWVHSLSRRLVRDEHMAEDVTQAVFIVLSRRASTLSGQARFRGWLFNTTRFAAADALKLQARRRRHEQRAAAMKPVVSPASAAEPVWEEVAPLLDTAVAPLSNADRDAVLLRFYGGRSLSEVGTALGISEEAAKKRIARAVQRLRGLLPVQLAAVDGGVLAALLAFHVTVPAPAALVGAVVGAGQGSAAATLGPLIARSVLRTFFWAKVKVAAVLVAAVTLTAGAGGVIVHETRASGGAAAATQPIAPSQPVAIAPFPQPQWPVYSQLTWVRWQCMIDGPIAARIQTLSTRLTNEGQAYQVMRCDAEQLLAVVSAAMQARQTTLDNTQWSRMNGLWWMPGRGTGVSVLAEQDRLVWTRPPVNYRIQHDYQGADDYKAELLADQGQLALALRGLSVTAGPLKLSGSIQATVDVGAGDAVVCLGHLGQASGLDVSHLVVHQVLKATPEQMAQFRRLRDASLWVRSGTAQMQHLVNQAVEWQMMALRLNTQVPGRWTQRLPGGTVVRLLAVADPHGNPLCWWTGDGQPTIQQDWLAGAIDAEKVIANALIEVLDPHRPREDGSRTWLDALAPQPWRRASNFYVRQSATVTDGVGDGVPQSIGKLPPRDGAHIQVGDASYRLDRWEPGSDYWCRAVLTYTSLPDTDVQFVAVDKAGQEAFGDSPMGPGRQRTTYPQVPFTFRMAASKVDHISVRTRPRRWVTFSGFALQPAVPLPQVSDRPASPATQPSR